VTGFARYFEALTGHSPLRWQTRLFESIFDGAIPSACNLPTGLGKTSVIPIWLIALATQDRNSKVSLPRRLVYIVNRRTVVDQATDVVEGIRSCLRSPRNEKWVAHEEILREISSRLRALCAINEDNDVLAVSTLRGELADNEEWKRDPARPAIIVGTIDMAGSKLLFSGYGDGRYQRTHHAGLIGQDVLIVHDEAHLTPAFSALLRTVVNFQAESSEPRPVRVMELSATHRDDVGQDVFGLLDAEDQKDSMVADRLGAKKYMRLHQVPKSDFIRRVIDMAKGHEEHRAKVLIYVRSPETAQEIGSQLKKVAKSNRSDGLAGVAVLAGTIRGYERDALVGKLREWHFFDGTAPEGTVYLVSTSAGEVGIDLDADHMVCDITTLDSMIQRLGRVNRRGGDDRIARIEVVSAAEPGEKKKKSPFLSAIEESEAVLKSWFGDSESIEVGPRALTGRVMNLTSQKRDAAFSPKAASRPLTDILLDAWSLTSINDLPGRPEVAAYLHGLSADPPETYVAWRKEVRLLSGVGVDNEVLSDWFRACQIRSVERLRDETSRVREKLGSLLKAHRKRQKNETLDFPIVVLNERSEAVLIRNEQGEGLQPRLSQVLLDNFPLEFKTVVLPVDIGGLDEHGMLTANPDELATELDIAEKGSEGAQRERWIDVRTDDGEHYENLLTGEIVVALPERLRERDRISLRERADGEDEIELRELVLLTSDADSALERPESVRFEQRLTEHIRLIVAHAERIAKAVGLESEVKNALVAAAKWHDCGKESSVWQRYACNADGKEPLAKSKRYLRPRDLGGYRHEFGSLLRAEICDELRKHSERDLALHLIAAHHGWARPHFEPRSFDNEKFSTAQNEKCVVEVMRRFGRLQHRFGRWGLAWLESLLRCADMAASIPTASNDAATEDESVVSA
jgi:CRISPR-associated endonuclease/helicase Cas3